MWIRPATMLATAMRAGALASGTRVILGANVAANRLVIAGRLMATAAAKKSTAAATTTTRTAAPKKKTQATTTKSKAKRPAAKAKKTKTKAKAKPKPKPKAVKKSPEKQAAEKLVAEKKVLLEKGLFTEPRSLPSNAWPLFISQWVANHNRQGPFLDMKSIHADYSQLSAAELQELEEISNKNAIANKVAYETWVQSHTPAQIVEANRARTRLSRSFNMKTCKGITISKLIKDDRLPKPPKSAWKLYVQSKLQGLEQSSREQAQQAFKEAAAAWGNLPASERKVFEDLAAAERAKYFKTKEDLNI